MQIDDITKAAQERLAALDTEAKPHEDALATINAERVRLRVMIAAGTGNPRAHVVLPQLPSPAVTVTYPAVGPQWVPPLEPWTSDPLGTQIVTGTTTSLFGTATVVNGPSAEDVAQHPVLAPSFSS